MPDDQSSSPSCACGHPLNLATLTIFQGWVHDRSCAQCKQSIARSVARYQCDLCASSHCVKCVDAVGGMVTDLAPLTNGTTVWNARTCEYCVVDDDYGVKCQVTLLSSSEGRLVERKDLTEVASTLNIVSADPDRNAGGVIKYGIEVCFPARDIKYTIRRRYKEFLDLKQQLETGRLEASDKSFPTKQAFRNRGDASVIEERRVQLGAWLADSASKQTAMQPCWISFLEVPKEVLSVPTVQFGVTFGI